MTEALPIVRWRKVLAPRARRANACRVAERAAEMFVEIGADQRVWVPGTGNERAMLLAFLRWQRETFELKCSGLGPDDLARRAIEPARLSLLGLVRHVADVERRWFRSVLAGEDAPPRFSSVVEPDGDFDGAVPDATVVAQAWEAWRAEVSFADAFVASTGLDVAMEDSWRGLVSLRWVLVHMIEEYARHNGHADLLRERIDGRVGL